MRPKYIFLAFIALIAVSCKNKSSKNAADQQTKAAVEKRKNDSAQLVMTNILKNWKCDTIAEDRFCHPSTWTTLPRGKGMLCLYVGDEDLNTIFAVSRDRKTDINSYLKKVYTQLKADTVEQVDGYAVTKLTYENKETYFAKYYTQANGSKFLAYGMIFQLDNSVYEIGLKFQQSEWKKYSAVFSKMLNEYRYKGKPFFDEKDRAKASVNIDLSKL